MSIGTHKPVQFGIRLPVAGLLASPKAIARVAREAEKLGYDVVWVNDFIA
jgi:alkanesulfonate monooxygenase SsuD/methylene tetrahydromethanopterin reductase-like flavin-dependent oxidoreductase (luciferase family)